MLQQQCHCAGFLKIAVGNGADLHGQPVAKIRKIQTAHEKRLVAKKLGGTVTHDLIKELCCIGHLGNKKISGGNIRGGNTDLAGAVKSAEYIIVSALIEGIHVEVCARRNDTYYFAPHDALGGSWIFHLLTDSDLVPQFHQPCQIGVYSVIGDAAHGRALGQSAALSREGKFQFPGYSHCVVKEHFIKIPQTIKEQAVRVFLFCTQIMLHHGRKGRHQGTVVRHFSGRLVFCIIVEIFHSVFLWSGFTGGSD